MDGIKMFRPRGIPFTVKDEQGKERVIVLGNKLYQQREDEYWYAVFGDPRMVNSMDIHRIADFVDGSVLPLPYQRKDKSPLMTGMRCTYGAENFPPIDDWDPDSAWAETEKDTWSLYTPGDEDDKFTVSVVYKPEDEVWVAYCPAAHRWYSPEDYANEFEFETLEEAQYNAEKSLAEALSCPFCAAIGLDYYDDVPSRDKIVKDRVSERHYIPLVSMVWSYAEKPKDKGKDLWAVPAGTPPTADQPGKNDQGGVIVGWGWLEVSPYSESWKNYQSHAWNTFCTCSNCLGENGERTGRNNHRIEVLRVYCPDCGETLELEGADGPVRLEGKSLYNWPDDQVPKRVDGVDDPSTAGLFQLLNIVSCTCPNCTYEGQFVPELQCSSCDNPTPTRLMNVITHVSRNAKQHEKDGTIWYFRTHEDKQTGRIFHPDFKEFPATTDGKITVDDIWRPGMEAAANDRGEGFFKFFPIDKGDHTPQLTYDQFQKLTGITLLNLNKAHGVPK